MSTTSSTYTPIYQTVGTTTSSSYITTPTYTTTTGTYTIDYDNIHNVYNAYPQFEVNNKGAFVKGKRVLTEDDLKKEEKKPMDKFNFNFNFDFGPVDRENIAACPNGIAVKNIATNSFCYYDPVKCEVVDTPFTFGAKKFLYKMPVAVSAIAEGDVIMHNGNPMFVKGLEDNEGRIVAIDLTCSEEKYILPIKNMFGFNYVTKIVSLFDFKNCGASADQPFGNMLPFLLMGEKELDPMMLLMMSGADSKAPLNMTQNPMMFYLLTQKNKDMLPLMMMMMNKS